MGGLFEKMPIAWRFLGIGALFTLFFMGHVLLDLARQLHDEQKALQIRLDGLNYLEKTNSMMVSLQTIRGLSNIYLEGDPEVLSDIDAEREKITRLFVELSDLKQPAGEYACNEKLDDVRHGFHAWIQRFESYRTVKVSEKEKTALFDGCTVMIDDILYLNSYISAIYNVGETSNWHLYVLSELLTERVPTSIEMLGRLRGIVSGTVQHGQISDDEKEDIKFYIRMLKHNRTIIYAKLEHLFKHDPRLSKALKPSVEAAIASNRELVGTIEAYLENPDAITVDAKTFFGLASQNMENALQVLKILQNTIEEISRENSEERIEILWAKIIIEICILLGILTLFWAFYRSNMKYIQKVENAEKAKVAFLSHMSHEIRTPLNAILGFIDLLQERTKDGESQKYIDTIKKSSTLLLNIINDILDLSKIENGKFSIELVPLHPRRELTPIIAIYMAKAQEKEINFHVVFDSEVPECLTSDPVRLKQIISNLLSNAIKFTPEHGSVTLHIGHDENTNTLRVSVSDTGIGIPLSKQKKVFDAFVQAEESTTRMYGGTGLGLAICSKLVSMLGGNIHLHSIEGKGSTFSFEIPLKECEYCTPAYSDESWEKLSTPKTKLHADRFSGTVLMAEDNETNQMYMEILLKKFGLQYDIANDGAEAVEKFKTGHYDLILMDENMPNMNGLEATRIIRELEKNGNLSHTPIIAITANALKGDKETFIEGGMDAYLSKPVDKTELKKVFELFLKKEKLINQTLQSFSFKASDQ